MTKTIPVSVIVMTRNEEKSIERCLKSVRLFDEVFVVDSGSSDATLELASRNGAQIVPFSWNGQYPKKKQWSLDNLPFRNDWVLYLDADEEVGAALAREISHRIKDDHGHKAFGVYLLNTFMGKQLKHGFRPAKVILLNRHYACFPDPGDPRVGGHGEVEGSFQPMVRGSVGSLQSPLLHHPTVTVYRWFEKANFYTERESAIQISPSATFFESESQPKGRAFLKPLFARLPGKPISIFIYSYVLRCGFLDGQAGLHYAVGLSFYYWAIGFKRWVAKASPSQGPK